MKKLLLLLLLFTPFISHADVPLSNTGANVSTYVFHLYYSKGALAVDRDAKYPYDILTESFVQGDTGSAIFTGKIVDPSGAVLGVFLFNPFQSLGTKTSGRFSVKGPYYANAKSVDFYKDDTKLLAIDLSGSSFCNDDTVCNKEVGEDYLNCSNDCPRPASLPATSLSPATSQQATPAPATKTNVVINILALIGGIILLIVAIVLFRRNKRVK